MSSHHQDPRSKKPFLITSLIIIAILSTAIVYAAFNLQVNVPVTVTTVSHATITSATLNNSTRSMDCGISAPITCPDPHMIVGQVLNLTVSLNGTPNMGVAPAVTNIPAYLTVTSIQAPATLDASGNGTWVWKIVANSVSTTTSTFTVILQSPAGQP